MFAKAEKILPKIEDPLKRELSKAMLYASQARSLQLFYQNQIFDQYERDTIGKIVNLCTKSISIVPSLGAYETLLRSYDKCMNFSLPNNTVLKYSNNIIEASETALKTFTNNPLILYFNATAHWMHGEIIYQSSSRNRKREYSKECKLAIANFKKAIKYGLCDTQKKSAEDRIKIITRKLRQRLR